MQYHFSTKTGVKVGRIGTYISGLCTVLDCFFGRSRALAIVDRLSAVQSSGLTVNKYRENEQPGSDTLGTS